MGLILREEIDNLNIQKVDIEYDDSCPICNHKQSELISLFLVNNFDYDSIKQKIPDISSYEILKNHRNHITLDRPNTEMQLVQSDNKIDVDELKVTNSTIRALTARRMELESEAMAGSDEHIAVVESLYKWTKLKMEVNKRIGDSGKTKPINLANIIKIGDKTVESKIIEYGN